MNLYLDASQFINTKSSYKIESANNFSSLHAKIEEKLTSLKSEPKRIYALLRSTIRYKELLDPVIKESKILSEEHKLSYSIALLLIHDFLISKTGITAGKGPLKDAVIRHKTRLKGELTKVLVKRGISDIFAFNAISSTASGSNGKIFYYFFSAVRGLIMRYIQTDRFAGSDLIHCSHLHFQVSFPSHLPLISLLNQTRYTKMYT